MAPSDRSALRAEAATVIARLKRGDQTLDCRVRDRDLVRVEAVLARGQAVVAPRDIAVVGWLGERVALRAA